MRNVQRDLEELCAVARLLSIALVPASLRCFAFNVRAAHPGPELVHVVFAQDLKRQAKTPGNERVR